MKIVKTKNTRKSVFVVHTDQGLCLEIANQLGNQEDFNIHCFLHPQNSRAISTRIPVDLLILDAKINTKSYSANLQKIVRNKQTRVALLSSVPTENNSQPTFVYANRLFFVQDFANFINQQLKTPSKIANH